MKKLSILLVALSILSCKQQEEKRDYTIIKGQVENNTAENALVQGHDFEARIPIDEGGSFADTLHLKNNGLYQLFIGPERTEIYLERGKDLDFTLNADEFDESLRYSGDLGNSNNYLAGKYLWEVDNSDYRKLFSMDENQFLQKLDSREKQMDSLYNTYEIQNEEFSQLINNERKYSKAALIETYQDAHRFYSGEEDYRVGNNFYNATKDIDYQDTLAFRNSPAYQNLLDAHFTRVSNTENEESGSDNHTLFYLKNVDKALPDGYAKDRLMVSHLQFWLKPDENLEENFNIYKNTNPNPANLEQLTQRYNQLKNLTAGNASPTFDYENYNGGNTSLADLKGKYVYIDVWATWCGPCLREIPSLKKIEKEYSNKNLQVVSISIDEPKDYDKWKEMIQDKSLGGLQLMADNNWNSKFVKDYGILGIPRFILVDPKGEIVSADAPRPSDPELRKMLDKLL